MYLVDFLVGVVPDDPSGSGLLSVVIYFPSQSQVVLCLLEDLVVGVIGNSSPIFSCRYDYSYPS